MSAFHLNPKQEEAQALLRGPAGHILLEGGSRSGKTFLFLRAIVIRALAAARSRHAVLRFQFAHCKQSIVFDTWPKMMELCFPGLPAPVNKSEWFATLPNGSEVWFGGLDDKERVDKILGKEYATMFFNECSQISHDAVSTAQTRAAQKCVVEKTGRQLPVRRYYDCNPPLKSHWIYQQWHRLLKPGTLQPLARPNNYARLRINPVDNAENLPDGYLDDLDDLPAHKRRRFKDGEYGDPNPDALWTEDGLEKWRHMGGELPDMLRVVVGVDPSGASGEEGEKNDEIGITVAGLGTDGNGYLFEDLTLGAGPAKWGEVAASAYSRHSADRLVGEANFGGGMVEHVVKTADPNIAYKAVHASRGKVIRAEPIAALYEKGRIRHVGKFPRLEDELCAFSTTGYTGAGSPNRADAAIWAFTELFPGIAKPKSEAPQINFAGWRNG